MQRRRLSFSWVRKDSMDESGCQLTVRDVAPLLHGRYIIITGGKARNGSPIITFPDTGNFYNLSDCDYKNLIIYLTSVPSINFIKPEKSHGLQESDLGFVLVIDRRQDRWSSVKTVLWKIAGFFPGLIQMVFVLRPMGFFQKAITEVGYKFVRDEFKFNVLLCNSIEELHEHIDREQLIEDLDGMIVYNHDEWIEQRAAIEKFAANTHEISQALKELMQRLQEAEFSNDVPSTEVLIQEQLAERNEIKEDLKSAVRHGETLLSCIRKVRNDGESDGEGSKSLQSSPNKLINIATVERLLVQLDESEKAFHDFWSKHYLRLQQCLQLRRFELEFKELHVSIGRHLRAFSDMTETADSVARSEQLIRELRQFELGTKEDLEKADNLSSGGEHLIQNDHYAVDCIQPKCTELKEMCEEFRERLHRRYEVLHRTRDLQERIDKANKWCTRGMDLLATQQIERFQSVEGAETALREIEEFMTSSNDFKLNNPKEFRSIFESMITPDTKALVQQVLKRIEDVQMMCDKRKNSLKKVIVKPPRPVQPVVPEPANPLHTSPVHSASLEGEPKQAKKLIKKSSLPKSLMQIEVLRDSDDSAGSHDSESEIQHDIENFQNKRSLLKSKKRVSGKMEKISFPSDGSYPGLVMKELIDTERAYVYELRNILEGYCKEMDRPDMLSLQPAGMRGKKDVIFGNLQQIHDFHANMFLKDLESCRNTPALVGVCFIQRKDEFQMYSMYCQNKPVSESLRKQVGENNPFFKACQKRLGHKLPLGAYLLKPVQRITKYQLLLKEMLKNTAEDQTGYSELNEALSTMLSVLKYVNDIMHQVAITGFSGNLSDLGKLLMQGSFNVWAKKDKLRDLRFKPMQRHIFLYEKALLFCKRRDDAKDSSNYAFKHYLETRQIGLTENIKGDPRKFELWSHGRTEVYTIQASTPQTKDAWVQEVKRVLLQQLDQLKGNHMKYYSERIRLSQQNGLQLSPRAKQGNWYNLARLENGTCTNNNVTSDHHDHVTHHDSNNSSDDIFDDGNWSDAFSDSDHDNSEHFREHLVSIPMSRCVALCDYHATDDGEASMQEGDIIELIKMSADGWCYIHVIGTTEEGWVPSSYLERLSKKHSRSSISVNSGGPKIEEIFY